MSDDQLLDEHRRTWHGFAKWSFVSAALIAIVLALMALTLL